MKNKYLLPILVLCAYSTNAQQSKQIGFAINTTLQTNNTFRYTNSYVKGVPTIGYGFSLLYQQNLSNHFGFQANLNYIRHHKTFQIDFPLKDFSPEYANRPNYTFKYTIPRYRNVDLAIGLFYETKISPKLSLQLNAEITANYEVFWAKEISHRTYYENPNPIVDKSQFFTIYATHGVSKRHRSLTDYLILLTSQYRLSATCNYIINDKIKLFSSLGYERIAPLNGGEDGLFPVNFDVVNSNMIFIEKTEYRNKFNMLRFQVGVKCRINKE